MAEMLKKLKIFWGGATASPRHFPNGTIPAHTHLLRRLWRLSFPFPDAETSHFLFLSDAYGHVRVKTVQFTQDRQTQSQTRLKILPGRIRDWQ